MVPSIHILNELHFSVYGLFLWLGFVLFVFAVYEFGKDEYVDITEIVTVSMIVFSGAYIFSLVAYGVIFGQGIERELQMSLQTFKGEFYFWAGIVGGLVSYFLYKGRLSVTKHCRNLDCLGVAVPIALMSGKLGCFFQGCCFGSPTLETVRVCYPLLSLSTIHYQEFKLIHPVQMYEAVGYGFLFLYLVTFAQKPRFPGQIFGRALLGISVVRIMGFKFRGDLSGSLFIEWPLEYALEGLALATVLFINLMFLISRKICKP